MKKILLTLLFLFVAKCCFSAPTNTISIVIPVDDTVVSAADETARYNEITTKFNAHSHEDTTKSTASTWTLGDNTVGNKTFAVSTDDANDPALRFNTTTNLWTISNDGVEYSTHDLTTGTVSLNETQTILGVKTFYAATITNLTVTNYVDTRFKIGTFTRDMEAESGDVGITSVGFEPKALVVLAASETGSAKSVSWGLAVGTTEHCIKTNFLGAAGTFNTHNEIIYLSNTSSEYQKAVVKSMDEDGFTLTWTKVDTPDSGTAVIYYQAFR